MCLYSKSNKPSIAKKSITCYKILNKKSVYETPWQDMYVDDDIINGERNLCASDKDDSGVPYVNRQVNFPYVGKAYRIGGGYIHCFDDLSKAKREREDYMYDMENPVLFECEIPAGVRYYRSVKYSPHFICAKEIRFIRKID